MITNPKCPNCNGDGWYLDHSRAHYAAQYDPKLDCGQYGCPIQVQCERCQGTGKVNIAES